MRAFSLFAACALLCGSSEFTAAQGHVSEKITFVQTDGRSYVAYATSRSSDPTATFVFDKKLTQEQALRNVLYMNPKEYRWDTSDARFNLLHFAQGSFARLTTGTLSNVTDTRGGALEYRSWDGRVDPNGHFGTWIDQADGYTSYAEVWVLPQTFEILKYECNRPGEWVIKNNTVAYYGRNVNDLTFIIVYRPRAAATYEALRAAVGRENVVVQQVPDGVTVTLAATVLFPSGGVEVSKSGQTVLATIGDALVKRGAAAVAVEGHTDNSPISSALAKTYPTNWELSAARAINVVHFLASKGIPETALQARAFGDTRPAVPNNSDQNRQLNRRIVLLVTEQPASAHWGARK